MPHLSFRSTLLITVLLIAGMQAWSGFVPNYIMPAPLETAAHFLLCYNS